MKSHNKIRVVFFVGAVLAPPSSRHGLEDDAMPPENVMLSAAKHLVSKGAK